MLGVVMQPRVKFCGMTRQQDVRLADELGVDFIGLVFVPSSPRCVAPERAAGLRKAVRRASVVGVFDASSPALLNRAAAELALDFVQLHGKPDLELCRRVKAPLIQAFRGVPSADDVERFLGCCAYVLLDKPAGAEVVDLDAAAALPRRLLDRTFLAGGLAPENVRRAVERVGPFAVDCARGVESSPGAKDPDKMRLFLQHLLP
jgi:phosphoribosylanthranilate isomerase